MKIELENLGKRYQSVTALEAVSLQIPAGSIVAVIGLNGAGKSTLLRTMAGISAPSTGSVSYDGTRFSRANTELRRRMFWMPDFPIIQQGTNLIQHIAMMVRAYDIPTSDALEAKIMRWIERFDLLEVAGQPMETLSRGQAYKAALVSVYAVDPGVVMLDEPFASGIDPRGQIVIREEAKALAARGGSWIYTTQIPEIAVRFADLLCVLDHGMLTAVIPRAELDAMPDAGLQRLNEWMTAEPTRTP